MEKCWQVLALRKLLFMTVAIIVVSLIRRLTFRNRFICLSIYCFWWCLQCNLYAKETDNIAEVNMVNCIMRLYTYCIYTKLKSFDL